MKKLILFFITLTGAIQAMDFSPVRHKRRMQVKRETNPALAELYQIEERAREAVQAIEPIKIEPGNMKYKRRMQISKGSKNTAQERTKAQKSQKALSITQLRAVDLGNPPAIPLPDRVGYIDILALQYRAQQRAQDEAKIIQYAG